MSIEGQHMQGGYYIGQVIQHDPGRGIEGELMDAPIWFAFVTPPQKETAAKVWLERRGVECWFPTEQRWRRVPRGKVSRVAYDARVVPRYVFARFHGYPQWDVLRQSRWISGVIGRGDMPIPITDKTLSEMATVPGRLQYLRDQAAAAAAERRRREIELRTIRPGDTVQIRDGACEGWIVDVSDVHAGIASFIVPILGDRMISIETDRLEKVAK
ncbi:MAG: transcription termination/antitermination NusG family protein [Niabella sp.]